jgi:hypothetical protein
MVVFSSTNCLHIPPFPKEGSEMMVTSRPFTAVKGLHAFTSPEDESEVAFP